MTFNDPVFKAFNDFRIDDMPAQADISRRMLRRLEDIDNARTAGPTAPAARAALVTSVVAHAVVELETQLIGLKRQLGQGFPRSRARRRVCANHYECTGSSSHAPTHFSPNAPRAGVTVPRAGRPRLLGSWD